MYICDKTSTCDEAQHCGGAQPHNWCSECGNCPRDKTSTCIPFNECTCMDEMDDCDYCRSQRNGIKRIKCAAIRYEDQIYEGNDHASIGQKMVRDGICEAPFPGGDDQGFVTTCGKYVRRAPARMIALRAGQIGDKTHHPKLLFSEDLRGGHANTSTEEMS